MRRSLFVAFLMLVFSLAAFATIATIPTVPAGTPKGILKEFRNVKVLVSSIDGELVAGAANGGGVFFMNVRQPYQDIFYVHGNEEVIDVTFSNDKYYMASLAADGSVRVWNTFGQRPTLVRLFNNVFENASCLAISPADTQPAAQRLLAVASTDGKIYFYNILGTLERPVRRIENAPADISDIYFVLGGSQLLVAAQNTLYWVSVRDGIVREAMSFDANVTAMTQLNRTVSDRDIYLIGLENGEIWYGFISQNEVAFVSLGKFFNGAVKTIAASAYPKNQRVVFAASEASEGFGIEPDQEFPSEYVSIYNGYTRELSLQHYVAEKDVVNLNVELKRLGRAPDYIPVTTVEKASEEFSSTQEFVLFGLDINKPNQPAVLSFKYSWSRNVDWKIGEVLSAVVEPLTAMYYDNFRTATYPLGTPSFYVLVGTKDEIAKIQFNFQSPVIQYAINKIEIFDAYGPAEPVKKMRVTRDGKYLLVLDGGVTESEAGGIIKVWQLPTADRDLPAVKFQNPAIIYKTGAEFELIDFTAIPEFGLLFVTDKHEALVLQAPSFDAAFAGKAEFVPVARYSVPSGLEIIGIETYRLDVGGKTEYHLVAFMNNGTYLDALIGELVAGRFKLITGYYEIKGRKAQVELYEAILIPWAAQAGVLEPYIISIDKDDMIRFWRIRGDELVTSFYAGALIREPESIAVDPMSGYVAVATVGSVKVYRLADLAKQFTRPYVTILETNVTAVAVKDNLVFMGKENGELVIVKIVGNKYEPKERFLAHEAYKIHKIVVGNRVFTAAEDVSIKIW